MTGLTHDALFYDSDDEVLTTMTPFVRDGLDAGEVVLLGCADPVRDALAAAVGSHPALAVLPRAGDDRPAATALAWSQRLEPLLANGGRIRVVGAAGFSPDPDGWTEWARWEAVAGHLLAPFPIWGVCLYDTRTVPPNALADAALTHPHLRRGGGRDGNPGHLPPLEFLRRQDAAGGGEPDGSPVLDLAAVTDPRDVRREIRAALAGRELPDGADENVLAAVNELATNAVQYGRPPVRIRLWLPPDRLVCTVGDAGPGFADHQFAGYLPAEKPDGPGSGVGLWLARQLCDSVRTYATATGFTVRLGLRLG